MEEQTPTTPVTPPTSPTEPVVTATQDAVSSPLLKNPLLYIGLGAIIIIILGLVFLYSKEKSPESTSAVVPATESPTGSIEVQEEQEADAIEVGTLDEDFEEIDEQVKQL